MSKLEEVKTGEGKSKIISYYAWRYSKDNFEDKSGNEKKRKTLKRDSFKVTIEILATRIMSSYSSLNYY